MGQVARSLSEWWRAALMAESASAASSKSSPITAKHASLMPRKKDPTQKGALVRGYPLRLQPNLRTKAGLIGFNALSDLSG